MISFRTLSLPMFAFAASLVACTAEQGATVQPDTASTAQQAAQGTPADDANAKHHGPRGHHGPPGGPELLIGAALHAPIDLTPAQRATIEGLMKHDAEPRPDHRERPAFDADRAKVLAAAVRAGDVSSLPAPVPPDASQMQAHLAKAAARMKTLHDTLSADQRAKLVADVESHRPKAGPHPPHGPGGPGLPFGDELNLTDAQKEQLKAKFEAKHPMPDFEGMHAEMKTKLESFKAENFDATAFVTPSAKFQPPKPAGNPLADLVSVLTPEQREILAKRIEAGPPAPPAPPAPARP